VCRSGASTPYSEATSPRSRAASPGPSNRPSSWKTACSEHTLSSAIEKLKQTRDCVGSLDILDMRASSSCAAACASSSEATIQGLSNNCVQANFAEDESGHERTRGGDKSGHDGGTSRSERFLTDPHDHVHSIDQIIDGLHGINEEDIPSPFDTYNAAVRVTSHTMCGVVVHDAFNKFD
jgi:hypothetical protein